MTLEEKKEWCSKGFISWFFMEKDNRDFTVRDPEVSEVFIVKVIDKKFKVFGIDIVLPDPLMIILDLCVNGNPGQVQIVIKDLLNSIKKRKGPIPAGYVVTSDDFSHCFMTEFPIMEIPKVNAKYESLWIGQKIESETDKRSYNLCDTAEWWKEIME